MHPQPSSTASLLSALSLTLLFPPSFCWVKGNDFTSLEEAPLEGARSLALWIHPSPMSCQYPPFLRQDLRCRRWLELMLFQFTAHNCHQCLTANTPDYTAVFIFSFSLPSPTDSLPKGFNKRSCLVTITMMKTPQPKSSWSGKDLFGLCFHILVHH